MRMRLYAPVGSLLLGLLGCSLGLPFAEAHLSSSTVTQAPPTLYAVEFRTGPGWDHSRPPQEQSYFSEHSANLRRLRESGSLKMGARYSDKGLVVLAASSEGEARSMVERDPSVENGVFSYELHPLRVFYEGCLGSP